MNIFEQVAKLKELKEEMKAVLPTLDDKASFYYADEKYRDAWLIVQTQYQLLGGLVERMESILDSENE